MLKWLHGKEKRQRNGKNPPHKVPASGLAIIAGVMIVVGAILYGVTREGEEKCERATEHIQKRIKNAVYANGQEMVDDLESLQQCIKIWDMNRDYGKAATAREITKKLSGQIRQKLDAAKTE